MRLSVYTIIVGFIIFGCQSRKASIPEQTSIIAMVVNTALTSDSGIRSRKYWIDFSKVQYFDHSAIQDFLTSRSNFAQINSDSLLRHDTTWARYGFLEKMLIRFSKAEIKGDSLIIELDIIKATDGSLGLRFVFKKSDDAYAMVGSEVTWVS